MRLNKLLIIDLESTCYEEHLEDNISDIIEIGTCLLNLETKEIELNESIYVIPLRSKINDFCLNLTGISEEIIKEKGISLKEACSILESKYNSKNVVWGSWGYYDKNKMTEQCQTFNINYPLNFSHVNLKTYYSLINNLSKEYGLKRALMKTGIDFKGRQHSGKDDAYNTAKLFLKMLK